MRDISQLPLINPPFLGIPPESGVMFRDKSDFVYEMIERKPHTNKDGSSSWLLTFRCTCAQCGTLFLHTQGPLRENLPRRCPPHAKGKGREKTYPWGRAPVAGGSGLPDWRVIHNFLKRFDKHVNEAMAEAGKGTPKAMLLDRAADLVADFFVEEYPHATLDETAEDDPSELYK